MKILVLLTLIGTISCADLRGALDYLGKFGYINEIGDGEQLLDGEAVTEAIAKFQAFAGLEESGELDEETVELMGTPRCGVKDVAAREQEQGGGTASLISADYQLQGSRWRKNVLTYKITKYSRGTQLSRLDIQQIVDKSFKMWEEVSGLTFTKATGTVDIDVSFERYDHGDGDPFDGSGGTLAHAFFPQFGGDVHMDDSESWTRDTYRGINLLQTLVHEIGHSLGLSHSEVRDSIMAPFYREYIPNMKLHRDDIDGIVRLYGRNVNNGGTVPTVPPSGSSDLCSNSHIDAIFRTGNDVTFVFQGELYWKLTDDSVAEGYPRRISADWDGLPGGIDAAFLWPQTGMTYFFKGTKYWKYKNQRAIDGYPKLISDGFGGIPNYVDAAFVFSGNGKIYFFKGGEYWLFNTQTNPPVDPNYPQSIQSRWGLPSNIEDALQWKNGKTYFFKDGEYYRYNDQEDEIDSSFPRPTSVWWFGC